MDQLHLELKGSIGELEQIGVEIARYCSHNHLDDKLRYSLQLVCDEWVTNIITHGYKGSAPASDSPPIEVILQRMNTDTLVLTFLDRSPPFNPLTRPEPDLSLPMEERPTGGLGIHFIKRFMDHCQYEREDGVNRLVLTKKIQTQEEISDEHND